MNIMDVTSLCKIWRTYDNRYIGHTLDALKLLEMTLATEHC